MKRADIAILGAKESGTGAAVLAKKLGMQPWVSDLGNIREEYRNILVRDEIPFEEGRHSLEAILSAAEIIKSPGIPDHSPVVVQAREKGIPVVSEIEFAARHSRGKLILITGSNGKTTTTLLTHHILKTAGLDACLAGNVGKSFAMAVSERDHDLYVLEISSFQLDGMFGTRADIAVLLNITPDHLDRYNHDFSRYTASKFRVIRNQTPNDHFIYCQDDPVIRTWLNENKIAPEPHPFTSGNRPLLEGAFVKKNKMLFNINEKEFTMTLEELALQGRHNLYNSMAAGITARLLDIRKDTIKQCLSDFQNVEHRLEYVASIHGVEYINDSKATNVNSTWYALESMHRRVVWIAGGQDKGNDYSSLVPLVKSKVRAIICLGKDNGKIRENFAGLVEIMVETQSAEEAVKAAYSIAVRGETVLLSPACASFDLFENFEDRGNQFKKAIKKL
jgi:UDP-N-acetylmuramoylalanine--D-glutamate ligase